MASVRCDLCSRIVPLHASYVLKMSLYADPAMPAVSEQELAAMDLAETMSELFEQMKELSADDLQDQVYRSFEYRLCPACQKQFLANPLGKPRRPGLGTN
jgi:hypothetical protein